MKTFLRFFLLSLLLAFVPQALAQSAEYQVTLTGPDEVQLMDAVTVVLEVTDADGAPVSGLEPEISFDPGDAVSAEILYDCEDSEFYDYCKANHRGVPGIFEIHFVMEQRPLLIEALVEGVRKGIRLDTIADLSVADSVVEEEVVPAASQEQILPEHVQAGPSVSFWFIGVPFVLMMSVVSFFVFSTTR